MTLTEKHWKFLYKVFRYLGCVGTIVIGVVSTALIGYYSANRPHVPQPDHKWTVPFNWSFNCPSYGTAQENARLISLFWWGISFGIFFAIAEAIRIYKIKGYKDDIYKSRRW